MKKYRFFLIRRLKKLEEIFQLLSQYKVQVSKKDTKIDEIFHLIAWMFPKYQLGTKIILEILSNFCDLLRKPEL